jgi:predicted ester cyclase
MVAEGDMVATYGSFTGTQDGRMGLFPPTDKEVDSKFLSIIRLEDGKIAELWVEWDNLAILTQLGHFPPPVEGS